MLHQSLHDFSNLKPLSESSLLITDDGGIALEYYIIYKKPVLYINYLETEGYSTSSCNLKSMKSILVNIPNNAITYKQKHINYKTVRGYDINIDTLNDELDKLIDL